MDADDGDQDDDEEDSTATARSFNFPPRSAHACAPAKSWLICSWRRRIGRAQAGPGIDPALAYNHDSCRHARRQPPADPAPPRGYCTPTRAWTGIGPCLARLHALQPGQGRPAARRKTRALSWVVLKWVGCCALISWTAPTPRRALSPWRTWQILTWVRWWRSAARPPPRHQDGWHRSAR